jgi:hypothetical protein
MKQKDLSIIYNESDLYNLKWKQMWSCFRGFVSKYKNKKIQFKTIISLTFTGFLSSLLCMIKKIKSLYIFISFVMDLLRK